MRRACVVARVVLSVAALAAGLAGCGEGKASREGRVADLRAAYEAVVAIQSATITGVTYIHYLPRVSDAVTALAVYEPEDDEAEEVELQLGVAIYFYSLAGQAWATKFEKYESTAWREFREAHPEFGFSASTDVERAVQILFDMANKAMESAREGWSNYQGG